MEENSTKTNADGTLLFAGEVWFDPIEAGIRERVRGFIEELIGQELEAALGRGRYERDAETPKGYRNGARKRQLLGSFGRVEISVPRARMSAKGGSTQAWLARSGCRIKLHFVPAYCPYLNSIERLWGLMHRHITHNKYYATFREFSTAMLAFLREEVPKKWGDYCDEVTDNFRVITPTEFRLIA